MNPGKLIRETREKRKMTQKELSEALCYDNPQFLSLIENGHSKLPVYSAKAFCAALNINTANMKKALVNEYIKSLEEAGL